MKEQILESETYADLTEFGEYKLVNKGDEYLWDITKHKDYIGSSDDGKYTIYAVVFYDETYIIIPPIWEKSYTSYYGGMIYLCKDINPEEDLFEIGILETEVVDRLLELPSEQYTRKELSEMLGKVKKRWRWIMDGNKKLSTLTKQEAKFYFLNYEASLFTMGRENPEIFNQYKELNVSEDEVNKWRLEQLMNYCNNILENNNQDKIWSIFNKMAEQIFCIKTEESIYILCETLDKISAKLDAKGKLIVCETILGRKHLKFRSGLIHLAVDLNATEVTNIFRRYVYEVISIDYNDDLLLERAKNNEKTYIMILEQLNLSFEDDIDKFEIR